MFSTSGTFQILICPLEEPGVGGDVEIVMKPFHFYWDETHTGHTHPSSTRLPHALHPVPYHLQNRGLGGQAGK